MSQKVFNIFFAATVLFGAPVLAEITEDLPTNNKKPLYELGVGAGSGFFPHYPGSDQGKWRTLAVPTFLYRGSIFRADEEDGVRAKLISHPMYGIELSAAGALPASSKENSARTGMPDLDLLGELGPQFYIKLQKNDSYETRVIFPLRLAASTDFSDIDFRGYTFSPGLDFRLRLPKSTGAVRLKLSSSFTSEKYQSYFYDVSSQYTTLTRPIYHASGGYMGTRADVAYSLDWQRLSFFVQIGYNNFKNAKNDNSPLFKSDYIFSGFGGFRWLLYQSQSKEDDKP